MGIWEPDPAISRQILAEETDLILLPGLAFDIHGNRLGYGKGCYDRFLSESAVKLPLLIALAWSFQILESIPFEDHDQPCHFLFTEKDIIPTVRKSF